MLLLALLDHHNMTSPERCKCPMEVVFYPDVVNEYHLVLIRYFIFHFHAGKKRARLALC